MSPTMMLHFPPPAGLQAPSPGPVLSSNATSDNVVLAANASQNIMIGRTYIPRLPQTSSADQRLLGVAAG